MTYPRTRSVLRRVPVTDPAAGASFTRPNDSGQFWLMRGFTLRLVTSAVVGNRLVGLSVAADAEVWFRTVAAATQAATLTRNYHAWPGAPSNADNAQVILVPWPTDGIWVPPGHTIAAQVDAIDVADQLSRILLDVVEAPTDMVERLVPAPYLYTIEE